MPQALRQSEVSTAPAAGLEWLTAEEAARRMGVEPRSVQRSCKKYWARFGRAEKRRPELQPGMAGGGKSQWYVRTDAHKALLIGSPTTAGMQASLESEFGISAAHRAYRSFAALDRWLQLCSGRAAAPQHMRLVGKVPTAADLAKVVIAEFAVSDPKLKVSVSTLKEWKKKFRQGGGIRALVPKYKGGDGSGTGDGSITTRSAAAITFFYENYHVEGGESISGCHRLTLAKAAEEGWSWPASEAATRAWLEKYDDLALTLLMREGHKAWTQKFMPYREMDWDAVGAGQWYVTDHTNCDFFVEHDGKQIRPWLTAILDCRSRCIVGWHLGPAPHQDAILAAMRMAFAECIPDFLRIDNGKDFTSKTLTGLTKMQRRELQRQHGENWNKVEWAAENMQSCDDPCWRGVVPELGIQLIYAIPYAPWSKGLVERWFGTYHEQCDKTFISYCGHNPIARPESLQEIREREDLPTMEQAETRIAAYIQRYHAQRHSSLGCSPQEVWDRRERTRKADKDALLLLMGIRGEYTVGPNGVRITLGKGAVTYGGTHPALRGLRGRKVLVKFDEAQPDHCFAFEVGTKRPLGRLQANERIRPGVTGQTLRESFAVKAREQKIGKQAERSARQRKRTAIAHANEAAMRTEQQLRATGTDGKSDFQPTIVPVRTGFEGVSTAPQTRFEVPPEDDVYANVSLVDLAGGGDEPESLPFSVNSIDAAGDGYAGIQLSDLESESNDNDGDIYAGIELSALGDREDEDDLLG